MIILLTLLVLLVAVAYRIAYRPEKLQIINARELAYYVLYAYLAFLLPALPLVWFNRWSLFSHSALVFVSGLPAFYRLIFHRNYAGFKVTRRWGLAPLTVALVGIGIGISLQWDTLFYLYGTHDPSAYLSSAIHLARTGQFFHSDELTEAAYSGKIPQLKSLLNQASASDDWRLTGNFGVIPQNLVQGLSTYHGLFAAPIFYAAGISVFGEKNCVRVNAIHLAATAILIAAIVETLTGGMAWPAAWAVLIYCLMPLVATIFRESLSEPLAAIYFLGLCFTSLEFTSDEPWKARYSFLFSLLASLCTRVSGLMYLPFFALLFIFLPAPQANRRNQVFAIASFALIGFGLALMLRLSPTYVTQIIAAYSAIAMKVVSHLNANFLKFIGVGSLILMAGLVLAVRKRIFSRLQYFLQPIVWRNLWRFYFLLLGAGLLFRYLKLVTKLNYYIGGYPFVLYDLDSLLFYGCPWLVVTGWAYWFNLFAKRPNSGLLFLQFFAPFIFFFYAVFRFLPLNLQPNFQRYFLIELLPLAVIGAACFCNLIWQKFAYRRWVRIGIVTALIWNSAVLVAISHNDLAKTAYPAYSSIRDELENLQDHGFKPVLVAVASTWIDLVFLMPLSNAYDYPIVFIDRPFSYESSAGLTALINAGYTPLLFVDNFTQHNPTLITEDKRSWVKLRDWEDSIHYPRIGLGAPPIELAHLNMSMAVFKWQARAEAPPLTALMQPAYLYRNQSLPISAIHWFGFEVDGPKTCAEKASISPQAIHFSLLFDPETTFTAPQILLNGNPVADVRVQALHATPTRSAHRVTSDISVSSLNCLAENKIDINFFPIQNYVARRMLVESIQLQNENPNNPLMASKSMTH